MKKTILLSLSLSLHRS
uniref:Truncated SabA n=1 Tax=Helicobacter pylori TaxID=210 RepID=L7SZT9_HELPX|nr:truncated SabA [Helicobacter pylori]